MKYTGTIVSIADTQNVSDKFQKREFIVTDKTEKYPQTISFECQQTHCGLLDSFRVGSLVDVEFNLRGKDYKGRNYNTLVAWKISNVQVNGTTNTEAQSITTSSASVEIDSGLPF